MCLAPGMVSCNDVHPSGFVLVRPVISVAAAAEPEIALSLVESACPLPRWPGNKLMQCFFLKLPTSTHLSQCYIPFSAQTNTIHKQPSRSLIFSELAWLQAPVAGLFFWWWFSEQKYSAFKKWHECKYCHLLLWPAFYFIFMMGRGLPLVDQMRMTHIDRFGSYDPCGNMAECSINFIARFYLHA